MNAAIATHKTRPIIGRVFGFRETRPAYEYFDARQHVGKVVIAGE
jgi:NADPH:quinone reductase-like Zn-dependent oxidoreductase